MKNTLFINLILLIVLFVPSLVSAQTNEFAYQGNLNQSGSPAIGNYDFEFKLYDTVSAGTLLGARTRLSVPVSNGTFTVRLDFPATSFNGNDRYLEIGVKPAGSASGYTTLAPRQKITSSPYSIKSLNAANADIASNSTQLGGVNADQFVQTIDTRLSNDRNPLPGSVSYIQNRTSEQTLSNFNISGTGKADTFNAATFSGTNHTGTTFTGVNFNGTYINAFGEFRINGNRVLSVAGTNNTFVGRQTGTVNTGTNNSFFGFNAGNDNTSGVDNAFFGSDAGGVNTSGDENTFFGSDAGDSNTLGDNNTFIGRSAGTTNTTGNGNTFIGWNAGLNIITGYNNTFIGTGTSPNQSIGGWGNISYSTAIGAGAIINYSNEIKLGRETGSETVVIPGNLRVHGSIRVGNIDETPGSVSLCLNAFSALITTCSSSLRYKTNVKPFNSGLNLVNRLKPISFNWKDGGMSDLGLGAEDVAAIEPLLVNYNKDGRVDGVKYDRIGVILLNAVKEQQMQIEEQQKQFDEQKKQIEQQQFVINGLKKLICQNNSEADVCKEK